MNPGRELDALVAEKVMGVGWCQLMHENVCLDGRPRRCKCGAIGFPFEHHAPYSTDIKAAWSVVEWMYQQNWHVDLKMGDHLSPNFYCMVFTGYKWPSPHTNSFTEGGDSAPHAICLAALKAVGHRPPVKL